MTTRRHAMKSKVWAHAHDTFPSLIHPEALYVYRQWIGCIPAYNVPCLVRNGCGAHLKHRTSDGLAGLCDIPARVIVLPTLSPLSQRGFYLHHVEEIAKGFEVAAYARNPRVWMEAAEAARRELVQEYADAVVVAEAEAAAAAVAEAAAPATATPAILGRPGIVLDPALLNEGLPAPIRPLARLVDPALLPPVAPPEPSALSTTYLGDFWMYCDYDLALQARVHEACTDPEEREDMIARCARDFQPVLCIDFLTCISFGAAALSRDCARFPLRSAPVYDSPGSDQLALHSVAATWKPTKFKSM